MNYQLEVISRPQLETIRLKPILKLIRPDLPLARGDRQYESDVIYWQRRIAEIAEDCNSNDYARAIVSNGS